MKLSLILLATSLTLASAETYLELGPMLGHVGPDDARIWVKASDEAEIGIQVSTSPDLEDAQEVPDLSLTQDSAFAGTVQVDGLEPDTRYYYAVELDGQRVTQRPYPSFTTSPEADESSIFRFAVISCAGGNGFDSAPAWGDLAGRAKVDFLLQLGDNHYADSTDPEKIREGYATHREVAGFRDAAQRIPMLAIWDDHDYGPNDSDKTAEGKEDSLKTFREYWGNPAYGEEDNEGIYFKFSRGDVDFFMLDVRYHRSPNSAEANDEKSILGERQMAWLKEGLKNSDAKVKFVASGSEFQRNGHKDSWTSFKKDQDEFMNFVKEEDVQGVILLSGDRHFTGGYQIDGRVIEITSGPFGSKNFPSPNLPEMFMNHGEGKMYSIFEVNTRLDPPAIALEVYRTGQGLVERRDFTWDEVNGDAKLALLPIATNTNEESESEMPLVFKDDFTQGADRWQMTDPHAWRVIEYDGDPVLSLHRQSKYEPPFRSPLNIARVKDVKVSDFEFHARVITTARDYGHRSMCLFFGYQDPSHFYYVHLGQETDDHANQIFIVNNAPRTKISTKTTEGTPWDSEWHDVKITRDVESGKIAVYWDDMETPVMEATDKTFTWGQVGLGAFDDTGNWDDIRLYGSKVDE